MLKTAAWSIVALLSGLVGLLAFDVFQGDRVVGITVAEPPDVIADLGGGAVVTVEGRSARGDFRRAYLGTVEAGLSDEDIEAAGWRVHRRSLAEDHEWAGPNADLIDMQVSGEQGMLIWPPEGTDRFFEVTYYRDSGVVCWTLSGPPASFPNHER